MADYAVMVKDRAKVFLGGPPLVKMATGEESTDEELGGAEMHSRRPGSPTTWRSTSTTPSASAARSSPPQLAQARLRPDRTADEPLYDPDEMLGSRPPT